MHIYIRAIGYFKNAPSTANYFTGRTVRERWELGPMLSHCRGYPLIFGAS